jgi:thiol-disulfide isomerase/thioredoxin
MTAFFRATLVALLVLPLSSCSSSPTSAQDKDAPDKGAQKKGQEQDEDANGEADTVQAVKELGGQLKKLMEAKGDDAAKEAPNVVKAVKRFLGKTDKDEQQYEVASYAALVLEMKGETDSALKLLAELKSHYADADKDLATAAAKSHESAEKRFGLVGKTVKLEGSLVSGKELDWSKYKGKIVLVDFWATWCEPCLREMPGVKENYEKYRDKGFEVVGISLDDPTEAEVLRATIKALKLPWENVHPGQTLAKEFGVQPIPFTMLLNREGKVLAVHVRGEELGEQLEKLLGKKAEKK